MSHKPLGISIDPTDGVQRESDGFGIEDRLEVVVFLQPRKGSRDPSLEADAARRFVDRGSNITTASFSPSKLPLSSIKDQASSICSPIPIPTILLLIAQPSLDVFAVRSTIIYWTNLRDQNIIGTDTYSCVRVLPAGHDAALIPRMGKPTQGRSEFHSTFDHRRAMGAVGKPCPPCSSTLRPTHELFEMAHAMFRDLWDGNVAAACEHVVVLEASLKKIDRDVGQFLDRVVEADSPTIVKAYEKRIRLLEEEKALVREKIANCGRPVRDFDASFSTAMGFLANPYNLWVSDDLEDKRLVLKLTFADRLSYVRGEGFRTAVTSSPFTLLSAMKGDGSEMVPPTGLEPVTLALRMRCSTS